MPKLASTVPDDLGAAGRDLWVEITSSYRLRPDELRILREACYEADLLDRIKAQLAGAPLTVRGSQGQEVAHPLVQEVRQHGQVMKAHLAALKLPDEPGEGGTSASEAGRALVNNRWRRSS